MHSEEFNSSSSNNKAKEKVLHQQQSLIYVP